MPSRIAFSEDRLASEALDEEEMADAGIADIRRHSHYWARSASRACPCGGYSRVTRT